MTGSHMMLSGAASAPAAPGGDVTPDALPWMGIYGVDAAWTDTLTVSGISTIIFVTVSKSGGKGSIVLAQNGIIKAYSGGVTFVVGDTIAWGIQTDYGGGNAAGTLTITNTSDSNKTLATIGYSVKDSGYGL